VTLFDDDDREPVRVVVEADGGSRGNPGPAGYGAVVRDSATGSVLAERNGYVGDSDTNNVAEYRGLIAGLEAALALGATRVDVRMDSKLVIDQMLGNWRVKTEHLRPLNREALQLSGKLEQVTYDWIPREENKLADRLANDAMDARATTTSALPVETAELATPVPPPAAMAPNARTRLILLRHGVTEYTLAKIFAGRSDLPLVADGRGQAARAAERIVQLGPVDAIVASPLQRTRETGQIVADRLGLTVGVDDGFVEADFGDWDGFSFADIAKRWPGEMAAWFDDPTAAPPNGENYEQIAARVAAARDRVVEAHRGQTVVVVSHVTPIKMLVRFALGAPWTSLYRMYLDPASISVIDYFADGPVTLVSYNDNAHLTG